MALTIFHKNDDRAPVATLPIEALRLGKLRKVAIINGNLRGADLSFLDARGIDWTGTDFRGANLTQADLSRGIFCGCNFRDSIPLYARFREAIFDPTTVLHWRSHDLMSAILRFVAKQEYESSDNLEQFINHALLSAVPHTFREWCWPEYKKYLPAGSAKWMAEALRPWADSDPQRNEFVPAELLEELYGR